MSATAHSTDSARINLRTSPEAKALIERAAALMGTTVSGFMLQNAYEAAQRVVADNGAGVIGFVTVSVGRVAARALSLQPKLPRHPAPMLRIGRLAVDKRAQGKGVGRELLAFALHLALEFAERVGLYAIVVDAKDAQAAEFYRRLHFEPTLDDGLCRFLPLSRLAKAKTP